MSDFYKVTFTRHYYISKEEVIQRKCNNETKDETIKRLATNAMEEDGRNGFLNPCDDNYLIQIK